MKFKKIFSTVVLIRLFAYLYMFLLSMTYESGWGRNLDGQATDDNTALAHCIHIPNTTRTHSEYVILPAFPLQQWLHECPSVLRYTYIACLLIYSEVFILKLVAQYSVVSVRHLISVPVVASELKYLVGSYYSQGL